MSLEGRGIWKTFDGREILQNVDYQLSPGEVTILLGRSGSGKTTLLRALSLVEPPDSGQILLNGTQLWPSKMMEPSEFWPRVTVVFQDLYLWPHMTARHNIAIAAKKVEPETFQTRLEEIGSILAIENLFNRYPNQMSRGQRQLVALARGLCVRPEYLLVDEITASLDVHSAARATSALINAAREGVGIMAITHQIGFARRIADHFAFLEGGTIVEQGGREALANPSTKALENFIRAAEHAL